MKINNFPFLFSFGLFSVVSCALSASELTFEPQGRSGHQTFEPQGGAGYQTFVPQGGTGHQTFEPRGGAGHQTFVPQAGIGQTIHAPAEQSQLHYLEVNLKGTITSGDSQKGYIVKITDSSNPKIVANGQEVWIPHDNPNIHYMKIGQKLNVTHITGGTYQIPSGQVMHVIMGANQIP